MNKQNTSYGSADVAAVFESYAKPMRKKLLFLRELIFDVAQQTEGVGPLEETLKWGQASYLTSATKSGSTIRIDQIKSEKGKYAMYFHCQTSLVATFCERFPTQFVYQGHRAIVFDANDAIPIAELSECIRMALTYHLHR